MDRVGEGLDCYMPKVWALIADIVDSRSVEERRVFQRELKTFLRRISDESPAVYLSPLTITLGDEFQAVYTDFSIVLSDLLRILEFLAPRKLRIALAYDELTTDINPEAALEMDGPAFHRARNCMETLKKRQTTSILVDGLGNDRQPLIIGALTFLANAVNDWKSVTLRIACGLQKGEPVQTIAEELEKSPRAVYKNIVANHIRDVLAGMDLLTRDIDKVTTEQEGNGR